MTSLFKLAADRLERSSGTLDGSGLADRLSTWSPPFVTFCIVGLALGAGLAAAYGRELQARRAPDRSWWVARLLLLPLLAIGATAASEAFQLSRSVTAFTAAMLSLGGYDCLRLIEARWRDRILAMAQSGPARGDTSSVDSEDERADREG